MAYIQIPWNESWHLYIDFSTMTGYHIVSRINKNPNAIKRGKVPCDVRFVSGVVQLDGCFVTGEVRTDILNAYDEYLTSLIVGE